MSISVKYETYACTRCKEEVPWYKKGDEWRDWEYERKLCSACRAITMTSEEREGRLPNPLSPCACGSVEFLRAPLREHVGDMGRLDPMHLAANVEAKHGRLYVLACRACGRAELRVAGVEHVPVASALGTEIVRLAGGGPYR